MNENRPGLTQPETVFYIGRVSFLAGKIYSVSKNYVNSYAFYVHNYRVMR